MRERRGHSLPSRREEASPYPDSHRSEYLSGEPLPWLGQRLTLMDHHGRTRGIVETTRVSIIPLDRQPELPSLARGLVNDEVAEDEGESFADAAEWRRSHEAFWADVAELVRADAGDPDWQLRDSEPAVVHWFGLVTDVAS